MKKRVLKIPKNFKCSRNILLEDGDCISPCREEGNKTICCLFCKDHCESICTIVKEYLKKEELK